MTDSLTLAVIRDAVTGGAVAARRVQRLVPAGGAADKVFPPTYEGGEYATEERVIDGARVPCVLLDSVQSQANRMEMALRQAAYAGIGRPAEIPVVTVDFPGAGLPDLGEITSLDAPHRIADAILRDSSLVGVPFRDSEEGKLLASASMSNATGLYGLCPTALVFGMWDSTGPRGGLGVKFQRALVSEIVAVNVQPGVRPTSRIDPLGIEKAAGEIYRARGGGWTLDPEAAEKAGGKPAKYGKDGKPSEINLGNVTPSLKNEKGQYHHGGVTLDYAQQTTVLSLPALRRLRFPTDGPVEAARDVAAQTALAALAIAAAELSVRQGCDLRSRCLLVPDPAYPSFWELVGPDGVARPFVASDPVELIRGAGEAAAAVGLPKWRRPPLVLQPNPGLVTLVEKSRTVAMAATGE